MDKNFESGEIKRGEKYPFKDNPSFELAQVFSDDPKKNMEQGEKDDEDMETRKEILEKRIWELKKEGKKLGEEEGEAIFELYGPLELINRIVKEKFEKLSEKTAIDLINSGFGNFVIKTSKYYPKFSKDVAKAIINYDASKTPFVKNRNPKEIKYELIQTMLAHMNDFDNFDSETAEYFSERGYDYIVETYPEKFGFEKGERKKVG